MNEILDDGLIIPEVGAWSEEKYKYILLYASIFSTSMKKIWDKLIYIDLFSGAGLVKIENTKRIIEAVPLRILSLPTKYDLYLFSDIDRNKTDALSQRIQRKGEKNTISFACDANKSIEQLRKLLPRPSKKCRILHYCLLDIYALKNLQFSTIESLASLYIDFFLLIPSFMDANRNLSLYIKRDDKTVSNFLGLDNWREIWATQEGKKKFGNFIVEQFSAQMSKLKYLPSDPVLVRSDQNNLPLYHLALFSRHVRGATIWKEVRKYANPQTTFEFS